MPISKDMVESEVSAHDARPKPGWNSHVEEKARTGFRRIVFEFRLHPAGQKIAGQRVDTSGGDGGGSGGIEDDRSTKLAGLKNLGMGFVKDFRRRDAMGNFPDVQIGLATDRSAEGKHLATVATDSDQKVDSEIDQNAQALHRETGPVQLIRRDNTPVAPPVK